MTVRREMAEWRAKSATRVTCELCLCQSRSSRLSQASEIVAKALMSDAGSGGLP